MGEIKPRIAVIGGIGLEGSGLALRWTAAKHPVAISSRSAERAVEAVAELNGFRAKDPWPQFAALERETAQAGALPTTISARSMSAKSQVD